MNKPKKKNVLRSSVELKRLFICTSVIVVSFFNNVLSENSHSLQSFTKVSSFHHHVSYGHLGVEVRFSDYQERLEIIQKCLDEWNTTNAGPFLLATFARLKAMIDPSLERLSEYQDTLSSQPFRPKRQIMGGVAIAMSAAALYDVEELRDTVGVMETRQNMMVRQLVSVSNATIATAKNVRKLTGAFHMLENNVLGLRHVATMEAVVLRIEEEVNGFFNGLDDLLSGRLTLSLVSESSVKTEFAELRQAAQAQGYDTVFPEPTQVFQLPVSFYVESGSVFVLVPIPIVPQKDSGEFDLYKFRPMPVLVGHQLVQLSSDSDFLAISRDKSRFVEVSSAMLDSCRHVGHTFLCSFPSVTVTDAFSFCLKDIFQSRSEDLLRSCNVHLLRRDFQFRRLNVTAFVSYTNSSLVATQTCGETVSQIVLEGYVVKNLEPGCVLHARSVTFVAGFSPVIEVNHVVTRIPGSFLEISNDSFVMQKIDEALAHFDKVDYGALLKGGEELSALEPLSQSSHHVLTIIVVVLAILVAVCILLLCCVWRYRKVLMSLHSISTKKNGRRAEDLRDLLKDVTERQEAKMPDSVQDFESLRSYSRSVSPSLSDLRVRYSELRENQRRIHNENHIALEDLIEHLE